MGKKKGTKDKTLKKEKPVKLLTIDKVFKTPLTLLNTKPTLKQIKIKNGKEI